MIHPKHIMTSAYPPEELHDWIRRINPEYIFVYIDFKNVIRPLYIDDVIREFLSYSSRNEYNDSRIFQSCLHMASYWKRFCHGYNIKCKIFFSSDIGRSEYHRKIYKDYKLNREILREHAPSYHNKFQEILNNNILLSENILNKLKDVFWFHLKSLESDFVPYYLITRKFNPLNKNILHVVCSNDKDMYQMLDNDHICQIMKKQQMNLLYDKRNCMMEFLNINKIGKKNKDFILDNIHILEPEDICLIMSLVGDAVDDVPGVNGIGRVNATRMIIEQKKYFNSSIYDIASDFSNKTLFNEKFKEENSNHKLWKLVFENENIVIDAFRMISYEVLCRCLEKKLDVYSIKSLERLNNILYKKNKRIFTNRDSMIRFVSELNDCKIDPEYCKFLYI